MTKAKTKTETLTILSYFMDDLNSIQKVFSSTNEEIKSIDFTRDVEDRHLDLTATNFLDRSEERTEITTTAVEDGWRINRDYHLTSTITRNLVLEDLELVALRKYKEEA